jgi:hypothetical protein
MRLDYIIGVLFMGIFEVGCESGNDLLAVLEVRGIGVVWLFRNNIVYF